MKKLCMVLLGFAFMFASAGLVACNSAPASVKRVSSDDFRSAYYYEETIDFDSVTVKVELSKGNPLMLDKQGDIDTDIEDASGDFEFILKTSGLAQALKTGTVELGHEYEISCLLKRDKKEYHLATVVFTDNVSLAYDLSKFDESAAIKDFKAVTASSVDEGKFMSYDGEYVIGDDNAFKFKPSYTLISKSDIDDITSSVYLPVNAKVFAVNGNAKGDEIPQGTVWTFDSLSYGFDFAEGHEGEKYILQLSPKNFETLDTGSQVTPIELKVTIADGYNVHEASELGHMCVVGEDEKAAVNACALNEYDRFRRENTTEYYTEKYYKIWNDFYTAKGETNLKSVNGIFLHDNLTITSEDVPSEYFVPSTESGGYGDGALRDWSYVFPHYMPSVNDKFTFNGNYFHLDFTQFPVALNHDENDALTYYNANTTIKYLTNSVLFFFAGQPHTVTDTGDEFASVEFLNVSAAGASGKQITGTATEEAAGTPTFLKVQDSCEVEVNNSIIHEFQIGLNSSEKGDWLVNDTKIFDCYNCGLYVYDANGEIKNSQLKRFGGPVVFSVSQNEKNHAPTEIHNSFVVDDASVLENFVTADQTWFMMNLPAPILVSMFQLLSDSQNTNGLIKTGKTILNEARKFNLQVLVLDDNYLKSNYDKLYSEVDFETAPMDYSSVTLKQIASGIESMMGQDPILVGDGYGHVAICSAQIDLDKGEVSDTVVMAYLSLPGTVPSYEPVEFAGDRAYIYCPTPGAARAGMIVSLYDFEPAA